MIRQCIRMIDLALLIMVITFITLIIVLIYTTVWRVSVSSSIPLPVHFSVREFGESER